MCTAGCGIGGQLKTKPHGTENPFIGLRPYKKEEQSRLFGRHKDTFLMYTRVLAARTTLLFAGSGVGKTSFLVAGLIPEICKDESYSVCFINQWSAADPGDRLRQSLEEVVDAGFPKDVSLTESLIKNRKNQLVLILDQFEEVFATYSWQPAFSPFLDDITSIVNEEQLLVRLVISMREEFLGELSVFDSRIPDLFGNYYRLKHLDKQQARRIVKKTSDMARVGVHEKGLEMLVSDLSRIERFRGDTHGSRNDPSPSVLTRDYIVPPYLQLVCSELWSRYPPAEAAPFLESYKEGLASEILRDFCAQKLNRLPARKQGIIARALDYLVTRQGAKLPYEYRSLADHLGLKDPELLREILEELADDSIRMLRASNRPDGSLWFELYHDMYAHALYDWKDTALRKAEEARSKRVREYISGIVPDEIVAWERHITPLSDFWVYLPEFLAASDKISGTVIDVMGHNMTTKDTRYLYIVEDPNDIKSLLEIASAIQCKLESSTIRVRERIRVLILRAEARNSAQSKALTRLLHVANCWIANPRGPKTEVYEVAWDASGTKVDGGRRVPQRKEGRIVGSLVEIVNLFDPPTLDEIDSSEKLEAAISKQPRIVIETNPVSYKPAIPEPK